MGLLTLRDENLIVSSTFRNRLLWIGKAIVLLILFHFSIAAAKAEIITVNNIDVAYNSSISIPSLGWANVNLPLLAPPAGPDKAESIWLKITFDRKQMPADNIAMSLEQAGGGINAFLNETPFFQSYTSSLDQTNASSQPMMFSIPGSLLHPGENSLFLRLALDSDATVIANGIRLGPAAEIQRDNQIRYFTQDVGPMLVSAVLTSVGIFLFLFWFMSRREPVMPWLGSLCLLSVMVSLYGAFNHFPMGADLGRIVSAVLMLLFVPVVFGLIATFYRDQRRLMLVFASAGVAAIALGLRYTVLPGQGFGTLAGVVAALAIGAYALLNALRAPQSDNIVGLLGIGVGILAFLHDAAVDTGLWTGVGFPLLPYGLLLAIGALGTAVGQRFAKTLKMKEDENAKLGMRIETTKVNLMVSENARRALEISNAVTSERERLMREIHDGIGSSLMAALASAERQGKQSSTAVVALKNALTDLRIAVDSLEPVEGNVATLLANLRYRIEPEMRKSGITFEWDVDDVPELDWLDAPNALHILRIFQETLGNIFGHANATKIKVSCNLRMDSGRPGIAIEVSDNGKGFNPDRPSQGRGRTNMLQRAEALAGKLTIESEPDKGSSTRLWLPLMRP